MSKSNIELSIKKSEEIMADQGKTFYLAARFFNEETMTRIFHLYAFCRYIDDCADELEHNEAIQALKNVSLHLRGEAKTNDELVKIIELLQSYGVSFQQMQILLEGALWDVAGHNVIDETELYRYCYRVAGVVGLMVSPIIGVKANSASQYAIDLGIAMQLTNICRDVMEDASMGRNYLPLYELQGAKLNLSDLTQNPITPAPLKKIVKKYLDQADNYYKSGFSGLAFIPLRSRIVVLLASDMYRAIGTKIRKKNYSVLSGRIYLTHFEKVMVAFKSLFKILRPTFWWPQSHQPRLHRSLLGFPGIDERGRDS